MIESLIYTATSRTLNIAMLNYNSSALLNSEGVFRRGSVSGFIPSQYILRGLLTQQNLLADAWILQPYWLM